jgi:hypothetical protein
LSKELTKEEPKGAGALVASEALRVLPENQKQIAGRGFGGALANIGAALEDVTLWVRVAAAIPRGAVQFLAKARAIWRRTPEDRRRPPNPELLLSAARGYASQEAEELREKYVRLLAAAVDSATAPLVHPAFANVLGQMTPVEARLFDRFRDGGHFRTYEALSKIAGVQLDAEGIELAMANLDRLGLVETWEAKVEPPAALDPEFKAQIVARGGVIIVEEESTYVVDPNDEENGIAYVTRYVRKMRTPLGQAFDRVCGPPRNPF